MPLIETSELESKINDFKIIDCSWHMPESKRNGHEEYNMKKIPNSIFFDLDKNSNKNTDLPHMLVDQTDWEKIVSEMGIQNNDKIVIYDNSDVISACRCWYNFIYFGHKPELIYVLNGGFHKWNIEKRITTDKISLLKQSQYKVFEKKNLVKDKKAINENIIKKKFEVIDARSLERFEGKIKEPREGLGSGSIQNSICIPFNLLINEDKTFKSKKEIATYFKKYLNNINEINITFSCGSGVTACVLALAYSSINDKYLPIIYDGSWAEYGKYKK